MFSEIAISISNVSKSYRVYDAPKDSLKQFILPSLQRLTKQKPKQYYHSFLALKNINIDIPKGQITGIIGKNGAGKSTLLQIICGVLSPTMGQVDITGRVAALLELGSGFNADFTGIENIYMNAQILGLDKYYIKRKIEEIKAFADIGDFIFNPIKTYSSGMLARLAFSVAVHVEPEILIVDEALSVGDAWFQHKSMAKMKSLMSNHCTVLFVSHSIDSVRALCDKVLWLEHGMVKRYGPVTEITNEYMNEVYLEQNRIVYESIQNEIDILGSVDNLSVNAPRLVRGAHSDRILCSERAYQARSLDPANESRDVGPLSMNCQQPLQPEMIVIEEKKVDDKITSSLENLDGSALVSVQKMRILNSQHVYTDTLHQNEIFTIEVALTFLKSLHNMSVGFLIKDQFGQELTGESVFNSQKKGLSVDAGSHFKFRFKSRMLFRGGQSYSIALRINQVSKWDRSDNLILYADDLAMVFDVLSNKDDPMWFKFRQDFDIEIVHG